MKMNVRLGGNLANFLDRLQHSGFVVRHHDGNQLGVGEYCSPYVVWIDKPATIHRHKGYVAVRFFQMLAGHQHGMMLDAGGNDVIAWAGQSRNRQIVAFGSAAGEDKFRWPATQQRCH